MMQIDRVRKEILRSFKRVPPQRDWRSQEDPEDYELGPLFRKSWYELAKLDHSYDIYASNILILPPVDMAYYLPAFMLRSLSRDENDGDIEENLLDLLCDEGTYGNEVRSLVQPESRKAITYFILYETERGLRILSHHSHDPMVVQMVLNETRRNLRGIELWNLQS